MVGEVEDFEVSIFISVPNQYVLKIETLAG